MAREQRVCDKLLRIYRLETETAASVSELSIRAQSVGAIFIPLRNEAKLRSLFESAGLAPNQVGFALQELARTARNCGFLVRIEQT